MPTRFTTRLVSSALCYALLFGPLTRSASAEGSEEDFFKLEEQVASLATKQPMKPSVTPSIVTVITDRDIRQHAYLSVAEALRWVPGFYDLDDMVFHNFGVRGINAGARGGSRILKVMINGQPTAFRSTTANFLGPELIPMSAVQKIEVVRGPGSALYGANAFLGVVNVVTKDGQHLLPYEGAPGESSDDREKSISKLTGATGQLQGTGEYIEASGRFGFGAEATGGGATRIGEQTLQSMASVSTWHVDRSGIKLPDTSPVFVAQLQANRIFSDDDLQEPLSLYSRTSLGGHDVNSMGKLTLDGALQKLDSHAEWQDLASGGNAGPPFIGDLPDTVPVHSRQQIYNGFMRLMHEGRWGGAEHPIESTISLAYAAGGPGVDDKFDTGDPSQFFLRQYGYQSFDLTSALSCQVIDALRLTIGLDHTADYHDELTYLGQDRNTGVRAALQFRRQVTINNTGVYGQAIVTPIDRISLTGGVRFDHTTIPTAAIYDEVTGRAGLVVKLAEGLLQKSEKDPDILSLKLLFGSSYQAPGPELLFGKLSQPGDIDNNRALLPQYAYSYEAQLGYRSDVFGLSANTFYNRVKDLAVFRKVGLNFQAQNASDADSYGFELESFIAWNDLQFRATTSYQRTLKKNTLPRDPTNLFDSRDVPLFPRWIVSFGPSYKVPGAPVVLSWDNQWVDSRLASTSNVAVNGSPYELSDYFLSTLTVSTTDIPFGASGGLKGYGMFQVVDLFDQRYADPGQNGVDYPSLGRRYALTLGFKF